MYLSQDPLPPPEVCLFLYFLLKLDQNLAFFKNCYFEEVLSNGEISENGIGSDGPNNGADSGMILNNMPWLITQLHFQKLTYTGAISAKSQHLMSYVAYLSLQLFQSLVFFLFQIEMENYCSLDLMWRTSQ